MIVKNPLLQTIKAAVERKIAADYQARSTRNLTDKLRCDILYILVTHSENVLHPTSENELLAHTLKRWQILAYVAGVDLTLAKWFESHLDALSILQELGYDKPIKGLLAVWAAEGHPLSFEQDKFSQHGIVNGTKAWCSGAAIVDYGLMSYRDKNGHAQLLLVDMQQEGIESDHRGWQAVGMQATDTAIVQFNKVTAEQVGTANAYLNRAGFWHGAAGVAACWYGAAISLADYLVLAYQQKPCNYKAMYLGQISIALAATQQSFHHVARVIDAQPQHSHELTIRQLRASTEQVARQVLESVGQALGAAPFCNNAHFARLAADLPVFIRQSHGAFDLQKIGELTSESANRLSGDATNGQGYIWQL